jgi:hypothetical protein
MEAREIDRLATEVPIPKVELPARLTAGLTAADVDELAATLRSMP